MRLFFMVLILTVIVTYKSGLIKEYDYNKCQVAHRDGGWGAEDVVDYCCGKSHHHGLVTLQHKCADWVPLKIKREDTLSIEVKK